MEKRIGIYLLIFVSMGVYVAACAPKLIPTSTIGAIESRKRLLMATQESEFKNAVISDVVAGLESEDIFIEITDVSNLVSKEVGNYNAILIVNNYRYLRINRDVRTFLEGAEEPVKEKIVLLTTAGSPSSVDEGLGVDAMSTASKMESAQDVSGTIIEKVNALLGD